MFTETTGIMLYVDDVIAEKEFWAAIGFSIQNETEMMGYESFEMNPHKDSSTSLLFMIKNSLNRYRLK